MALPRGHRQRLLPQLHRRPGPLSANNGNKRKPGQENGFNSKPTAPSRKRISDDTHGSNSQPVNNNNNNRNRNHNSGRAVTQI